MMSCTPQDHESPTPNTSNSAKKGVENYNKKEIDEYMEAEAMKNKGEFSWKNAPDEIIAAALKHSEDFLSVGYQIEGFNEKELTKINLKEKAWIEARQKIISIVFEEEKSFNKDWKKPEDVIIFPGDLMPNFDLKISQLTTIQKLKETGLIRYMEPSAYMPKAVITENTPVPELKRANQPFTFGCGKNEYPLSNLLSGTDFISMGGTPVSWNLISPGLVQTWARNIAGQGIKIAYFDTGCSYLQDRMHHGFAIGMSAARTLEKISTLPRFDYQGLTTPHDDCGHGTASTSVGTAPRSGGTSVGIAYQSDLLSVKTAYDPIINTPQELRGVADGFTQVGNRTDVKIISMSLGNNSSSCIWRRWLCFD